jgi:hypothetical protein
MKAEIREPNITGKLMAKKHDGRASLWTVLRLRNFPHSARSTS